jgi:protein TonB
MLARARTSDARFDWFGFAVVVVLHLGVLAFLYHQRLLPVPRGLEPLFVRFITPKPPAEVRPPEPAPRVEKRKPRPVEPPPVRQQLVVEAPPLLPQEPVAPPPPPAPEPEPVVEARPAAPAPVIPKSIGPVMLAEELSVSCPNRTAPSYPTQARRLREQGSVLLRVELDERGRIDSARVEKPSGSARLDDAALAAVRDWRCNPALREGKPVRAIALQPFNFVLE